MVGKRRCPFSEQNRCSRAAGGLPVFDCNDDFSALTLRVGNLRTLNYSPNPPRWFLSRLSCGRLYVEAKKLRGKTEQKHSVETWKNASFSRIKRTYEPWLVNKASKFLRQSNKANVVSTSPVWHNKPWVVHNKGKADKSWVQCKVSRGEHSNLSCWIMREEKQDYKQKRN